MFISRPNLCNDSYQVAARRCTVYTRATHLPRAPTGLPVAPLIRVRAAYHNIAESSK